MRLGLPVELPLDQCASCEHPLDHAVGVLGDEMMFNPGDFQLCLYCGSLNVFDELLRLRMPTRAEVEAAQEHTPFVSIQRAARNYLMQRADT